jgi:hypothetical protein
MTVDVTPSIPPLTDTFNIPLFVQNQCPYSPAPLVQALGKEAGFSETEYTNKQA